MCGWRKLMPEDMKNIKRRFYWLGALQIAVGLLALTMPLLASLAIETMVGAMFLVIGIFQGWNAFLGFRGGENPWQQTVTAVISLMAGLVFLFHPLAGIITLSIFMAAFFMIDGVMKVLEYVRVRQMKGSFWIFISGLLGIVLAVLMWSNHLRGATIMGLVFGLNFTFSGIAFFLLAWNCPKEPIE